MSQNRLKGLDCRIAFAGPDGGEDSLTKFKDFEITFDGEILSEDYTGEEAPLFDDVSNGTKVKATVALNDPDVFDFMVRVEERRRRRPGAVGKFSCVGNFRFPDGSIRRLIVVDLYFGPFPIGVRGRKEFVTTTIEASSSAMPKIVK
jgi:hypothetical protein